MNARTDSLFRKVQEAGKLNELMMFLEDPTPPKDHDSENGFDRYQLACALVNGWGIKCGRSAVWSLYKSYVLFWRMEVVNAAVQTTEQLSELDEKAARMAAQRTVELLADPEMDPKILVGLARLQVAKQRTENDSRRVAVLERQLQNALAVVESAKKTSKGGLTKETLEQVERELRML